MRSFLKSIFLFVVILFNVKVVFSQTITNVDAFQEGQALAIVFNMDKATDVVIQYSTTGKNGNFVKIPKEYLRKVTMTGTQYKYVWDVLANVGDFTYENVVFKVEVADNGYVDLGLSVKWATCNVGAKKTWEYGSHFTFEEAQKQGRVPTKEECQELLDKCTWTWTQMNGENGYKVTGKNGNSIFLPAAGFRDGTSVSGVGSDGNYWSSTANDSRDAWYMYFFSYDAGMYYYDRDRGRSVRLVRLL